MANNILKELFSEQETLGLNSYDEAEEAEKIRTQAYCGLDSFE